MRYVVRSKHSKYYVIIKPRVEDSDWGSLKKATRFESTDEAIETCKAHGFREFFVIPVGE